MQKNTFVYNMYILLLKYFFMEEKSYLAMLHKIWITHKKLHSIFNDNSNYKDYYNNLSYKTLKNFDFSNKQIDFILENKAKYKLKDLEIILNNREVKIITINDDLFPILLKEIPNIPYLFYLRWNIDNSPKIAVVWSRKITWYWESAIEKIVWNISKYFVIVSWWATWCDTKAHLVGLEYNNKTISIIWTWIDNDYPIWNKELYDKIVENGWWILSIFPVWEVGNPYNFPVRNEIVAWLSVWVLVIEAKEKSWTLITSNLALDMWKDLFAIPWDIFKTNSDWCNSLIKNGMAKLVSNSEDILVEYNILKETSRNINKKIIFADKIEESIYNILILESLTINELIIKIGLDIKTLSFKLSMMEINNIIKKTLWWKYEVF